MTTPRSPALPNILSNAVAPNTLSGMTAVAAHAPQSAAVRPSMRQLWRLAMFGGLGLALVITILGSRTW